MPDPVVNVPVVWHIEVGVDAIHAQTFTAQLDITLPPEVALVSGDRTWSGDLATDSPHSIDLIIRVLKPGTYTIRAMVVSADPGGTSFSASQTWIVTSTTTSATVLDVLSQPAPVIPTPLVVPATGQP